VRQKKPRQKHNYLGQTPQKHGNNK